MTERRWIIASDHAGFALKKEIQKHFEDSGQRYRDLGCHDESSVDYPDFAHQVAQCIRESQTEHALLICGTGTGMAMTANKHPHIRAAVCTDVYSAAMARRHNDANVLCLGARVTGSGLAIAIVDAFASAHFEGGRHAKRVEKIDL